VDFAVLDLSYLQNIYFGIMFDDNSKICQPSAEVLCGCSFIELGHLTLNLNSDDLRLFELRGGTPQTLQPRKKHSRRIFRQFRFLCVFLVDLELGIRAGQTAARQRDGRDW